MRRNAWMTAILVLALAVPALAQVAAPGRGHGLGRTVPAKPEGERETQTAPVTRPPLPAARVTGQLESLAAKPFPGAVEGVKMQTAVLKTPSGSVTVYLGPDWFVQEQKFPCKVGDTWEVTGHKSMQAQFPGIVAREVKTGTSVMKLRDERGQPLWRAPGR